MWLAGLQELERLCRAAGLRPVGGEVVRVRAPQPALYLGTGQADRIIAAAADADAAMVVFDRALSPMQLRNWGRRSRLEVYDRHAVILDWETGDVLPKTTEQFRESFEKRTIAHWT